MSDPNLAILEAAAVLLEPLLHDLVFLGGCATGLLRTDPAAAGIRPTRDVDAIAEVASYADYAALSERLRDLGLNEDASEGAPPCRWIHGRLIIDVMPTAPVMGFGNRWYPAAMTTPTMFSVGAVELKLIHPVYFIATKLEAFRTRGAHDLPASHDLEDIISVIDGRPQIVDELRRAAADVRGFIAAEFGNFLKARQFLDALPGFLLPDAANQARLPILIDRLTSIAAADNS
jgi:hypothetical protein